jgi:uncharacterized protein
MSRLAAAAVIAALALIGCGSSPSSTTTTTAALEHLPKLPAAPGSAPGPDSAGDAETDAFLREVFDDAQDKWREALEAAGTEYRPARLTIFRDAVRTPCGDAPASIGPFYCPASMGVYLDNRFMEALAGRAGVQLGDFAKAFIVAHEIGHHVQLLLGIVGRNAAANQRDPARTNERSVRLELQADCLAGVWMHSRYARGKVSEEDLADALRAAAVVGSDFQQRRALGTVVPELWTHGSSRQRQQWLRTGFEEGDPSACDTFAR